MLLAHTLIKTSGMTALYEAIGTTFHKVGRRLTDMPENERPGFVKVIICTDGMENVSDKKKWPLSKIKEIIRVQKDTYNWDITFLGADINAEEYADVFGVSSDNAVSFQKDKAKNMWKMSSDKMKRARTATSAGETVDCSYSVKEKMEINS